MNIDRKLTKDEVDYLFTFCTKHYVRDYDIQLELVDHLSNAIEDLWVLNPKISFQEALEKCYKSFGYKGFAGIVQEKTRAIEAKHSKAKLKLLLSYITLPKGSLLFMIGVVIYLLPIFFNPVQLKNIVAVSVIICMVCHIYFLSKFHKSIQKPKKQLLLTSDVLNVSDEGILLYIIFPFNSLFDLIGYDTSKFYFHCGLLVIFSFVFYVSIGYGKLIFEKARLEYPMAFD